MDTVNIFAPEIRNKIRMEVPFISGAWVDFYDDITADTALKAESAQKNQDLNYQIEVLISQVAAWNFADSENKLLPISVDSVKLFPTKILKWMIQSQGNILSAQEDKKKDLPVT